jgi:hypothetical protein
MKLFNHTESEWTLPDTERLQHYNYEGPFKTNIKGIKNIIQ